ncbi:MAG: AMP-binding protein [Burkholderiaceae bacterium]
MTLQSESQLAKFFLQHDLADYDAMRERAAADPEWFWPAVMEFHQLHFFKPFDRLLDLSKGPQWAQWCIGGTTNLAYNCLERTIAAGRADHAAVIWEAEDGTQRSVSYAELALASERVAAGLAGLGVETGDVVGLYMPMVPETMAAFFAILRLGAIALPMFSGFGAQAVADRLAHATAKVVITVDHTYRRGRKIPMLEVLDEASASVPSLRQVIVVERDPGTPRESGKIERCYWADLLAAPSRAPAAQLPAETAAMIIYTSGTTGKPKGTVHSHCGFLTKVALDFGLILDLQPDDRMLWMSDMGWLTGPILGVAAPLIGATLVLVEGTPDYPDTERLWQLVQRHRVSFLGVAPTMIRSYMSGDSSRKIGSDLGSLRVCASTGEPWTPEAWDWFRREAGNGQVPILNYSGGTEIGGGILAATVMHPQMPAGGFAGSIPGMGATIVRENGEPVADNEIGELALTTPSIGLTRGFWQDPERYIESYWSRVPGLWMHGDLTSRDANGYWFIHGRSDDTIKIAGKRVGPAEIEAVLLGTGRIVEAAAVGLPDPIKGAVLVCACVPTAASKADPDLAGQLERAVVEAMGASFRPGRMLFVTELPKTRTMKIMRRLVRTTLLGEPAGDLSGLLNPEALADLKALARSA